ncbi:hypothetical protein ACFE04_030788 [Oxalis oulophora]
MARFSSPSPNPALFDLAPSQLPPMLSPVAISHSSYNVMLIVAAMLCALVCALGLNSMLQCVFQCTLLTLTEPRDWLESRRKNSGLKKKEMVALPTSTYVKSPISRYGSTNCAICLADFIEGEEIRALPKCNHKFHISCIDKWLLYHSSCPTCRQRIKSNDSVICLQQIVTEM